jgi:hypothetical protein
MSVFDHKTVENAQKRSGTVNAHERSGTFRNGNDHNVQDHGPKRLKNHVHGTFTFTLQKRKKHCLLTCKNVIILIRINL